MPAQRPPPVCQVSTDVTEPADTTLVLRLLVKQRDVAELAARGDAGLIDRQALIDFFADQLIEVKRQFGVELSVERATDIVVFGEKGDLAAPQRPMRVER